MVYRCLCLTVRPFQCILEQQTNWMKMVPQQRRPSQSCRATQHATICYRKNAASARAVPYIELLPSTRFPSRNCLLAKCCWLHQTFFYYLSSFIVGFFDTFPSLWISSIRNSVWIQHCLVLADAQTRPASASGQTAALEISRQLAI